MGHNDIFTPVTKERAEIEDLTNEVVIPKPDVANDWMYPIFSPTFRVGRVTCSVYRSLAGR